MSARSDDTDIGVVTPGRHKTGPYMDVRDIADAGSADAGGHKTLPYGIDALLRDLRADR